MLAESGVVISAEIIPGVGPLSESGSDVVTAAGLVDASKTSDGFCVEKRSCDPGHGSIAMGRDDVSASGFCEGTNGVGQIGAGFRRDDRRGTSTRQTVLGRAFRAGEVKTEEENRTTFRLSALARVRLSTGIKD